VTQSVLARPHRIAHPDRVDARAWTLGDRGEPIPEGPIPGWDPSVDLTFNRNIRLDPASIRNDCDLPPTAPISVAVVWFCPATSLRSGSYVPINGESDLSLAALVPGSNLGHRLVLRTQVLLAGNASPVSALGPRLPGSVLWEDEIWVTLEGRGARFPMEWLEFGISGWLPPDAGWYLDWSPEEPDLPSMGSVRLLLNANHQSIREAVSAIEPDEAQSLIRESIEFDVARTLVGGALDAEGFWPPGTNFAEGTVGASLAVLFAALYPNDSFESLRDRWRMDPQRVIVRLQAAFRLYRQNR